MLVSTANITLKVLNARKLLLWWIGPLRITKGIGVVLYHMHLPITYKIFYVFHVSLLRPYTIDGKVQLFPFANL